MEVKDFINKNKSLLQKIGIGVISLVIVIMICLSPNIIRKLKGNVSSIDASTIQSVKNEVFISTSLKNDDSIDLNVYNYENKDIVITKIEYRNICKLSNTDCTSFSEFDVTPVTVSNNNSQVVNLSNIKDKVGDSLNLELGVRYTLDGKDYIVTTNTFAPVTFDSSTRNTLNYEQTSEEFLIYGYTKSSDWENNDNLLNSAKVTIKLTDNNVHMETTEKLSDFNLKYQMSSSYLYAWYIENPFKETTYKAKMLGLDNYSNFRDYFDYSYPTNTQTGKNGFNVSFDIPGNTPKATVTNESIIPTFFWYLGAKNPFNSWKWQHTSENGNIYKSDKVPQFKLTVYNKDSLKTAIENSLSKLNDKNSLSYNNESYFALVNEIENAKRLYSGRNYYNKCDTKGNNCVKTDVNQEQIDSYVSLLNNYEVLKYNSANYSKYNNIISKVESIDKTLYETDSYNNMMSVYGEKDNYANLLEVYQVRIDNYVDKLQEAYDNLVMLGADYTEVDKIIDKANKISNVVNENDELYTKDSWNALQNTINSVDRTLKIDKQSVVDGYVKTIQSAIDGLKENPAKYTTVDKIIEDYKNNSNYVNGYWTSESMKIVDDFIVTKPVNKKISEQSVVDNWTKELSKLMDDTLKFINAKGYVDSDNYHPTDLPNSLSIEGYLNYFKTEIAKKINGKNLYTDDTITKINNVINDYYDKNGNWKADLVYIKIDKQSEMDKLIKDIDNIKNNSFVKNLADYTKLKKIEQEANNLVRDNYKDLTDLDAKLKNANELSDKLKLDEQDKIDKVVSELEDAISKLELKDANYEKVNAAITKAKNIVRENYKDLTDLDAKLKTAKASLNLKIDKQKDVDKAAVELEDAISKLELKDANYEKVNAAITKAKNIVRENYKDLTDLDAKLKNAKNALSLKIDKQKEVDKAAVELETAISNLVLKDANYEKLNSAITKAENVVRDNYKDLTELDAKLKNAKNALSLKIDKQKEVDKVATELEAAITNLVLKDANYEKVNAAITKAENIVRENYKDLTNLDAKLNNAKNVLNLKIDKQKEVDKAAAELETAISNLVLKDANYEKVNAAITKAENIVRENYKDLTDLDAKLKTAKASLNLKIDKQKEVDKAAVELETTISNLELKGADYSKINDFKTNVYDKLDSTKYTNFDTLVNAMNNIDYSIKINEQEKVNEIYNSLVKVYNNLIKTRADYSKVELAINNAKKYEANKYNYTNYDEVEKLINSIDYNLDWGSQDKVDRYATDINYAISNLNKRLADYSKLAKVLSKLPADYSKYSSDIQKEIKEYLDEVKDLSTDLRYDEQDIIDEIVKRGNILLDKLSKIKDYDDSIKEDIKNDEKTTTTKKVTTIKKNSTRKNSSNKSKTTVKTTDSSKNNNEKVIKYIKINDEKIEFTDNKINLNVDFSVEKADVVVKLQNDEDKYEVYGGEVLMPGINTVTIIVTRKNGTTYRYDINIKRPETSNYLSSVEIKNSSIKFDKNKNNYTINVDKDTNKLDLIAKLEDKNATMKITGNSNLKNESKVEIKVTDTKGNTNTYVITVKKSDARYIKIIIIIVALLSALTVGYKLVQNKKRN